jgi:hypothetical protein
MSSEITVPAPAPAPVINDTVTPAVEAATPAAEAALAAAATIAEEKKAIQNQLKKYKLKVDGEEMEEEFDASNEEEVRKRLQLAKVAQKRMQENSDMKKSVDKLVNLLKSDPFKVLSDPSLGIDVKQAVFNFIEQQAAEEQKSPEQKEIEKLRAELQERVQKEKEFEEKSKNSELEKLQQEAEQSLETQFVGALQKNAIPNNPYTIRKLAEIMWTAAKNNIDISVDDAIPVLRQQMQSDIRGFLSSSPDEMLDELLGDIPSRLQKRRVTKAKAALETANSVKPTATEKKVEQSSGKKLTYKDFFKV